MRRFRLYRRLYNRVLVFLSFHGLSERYIDLHYYNEGPTPQKDGNAAMKRFLLFAVLCTLVALGLAYILTQPATEAPKRRAPYARIMPTATLPAFSVGVGHDDCQSWYLEIVRVGQTRRTASYYARAWGCERVNGVWQRGGSRCDLLAYHLQRRDLFTFARVGHQRCVIWPDGHWATE